jgi:hypothetical protein
VPDKKRKKLFDPHGKQEEIGYKNRMGLPGELA